MENLRRKKPGKTMERPPKTPQTLKKSSNPPAICHPSQCIYYGCQIRGLPEDRIESTLLWLLEPTKIIHTSTPRAKYERTRIGFGFCALAPWSANGLEYHPVHANILGRLGL